MRSEKLMRLALIASVALLGVACDDGASTGGGITDADAGAGGEGGGAGGGGGTGAMGGGTGGGEGGMGGDGGEGGMGGGAGGGEGGMGGGGGAGGEGGMGGEGGAVEVNVCDSCESDDDCDGDGACADLGSMQFCLAPCDTDEECEEGFSCGVLDEVDGDWCIPDSGTCLAEGCDDPDMDGYGLGPGCMGIDCAEGDGSAYDGAPEMCDGVDNDCDDGVDEDVELGTCGTGACAADEACVDGEIACDEGDPAADDATCDGTDDDCDGETDENYTSTTCGVGACEAMSMCVEGVESCAEGEPAMMDATCDLVDEDCDGRVDEDYAANAPSCGVGACARVSTCTEGAEACEPGLPFAPDDSSCNGVDDDCNGNVDEDYESDETCGVGACMRTATCSDGEDVCQPGEPLSEDDATCDGIDDNCNGFIDENCFRNFLGFEVSGSGDDFVEVDILYTRQVSPSEIEDGNRFLPRVMELSPTYPSGLSIGLPFNATAGQALVDAQKQIGFGRICPVPEEAGQVCPVSRVFAIDMDPDMDGTAESRMLVLDSAQNLRVGEGVLATVRFTKAPGDNGPWDFGWNADETTFAPSESYCGLPTPPGCNGVEPILELNGAMLQPAP